MARTLWNGNIAFGLVTIPVGLYTAVREERVQFHLLSSDGNCRLRRKLYCPDTGDEFDFNETVRGYEMAPDQYVIIQPDELEALEPEDGRDINIEQFVKAEEIDPIYFNRPYYVLPSQGGEKAYTLLVEALQTSERVGLARFVMRDREYLATLRVKDGVVVLDTMYYHDEIVKPEKVEVKAGKINDKERKLAVSLVESLTGKFHPEKFKNDFNERVAEFVEKKAKGKVTPKKKTKKSDNRVLDLTKALEASLKGSGRSEESEKKKPPKKSAPKKKAPAKPARKRAA